MRLPGTNFSQEEVEEKFVEYMNPIKEQLVTFRWGFLPLARYCTTQCAEYSWGCQSSFRGTEQIVNKHHGVPFIKCSYLEDEGRPKGTTFLYLPNCEISDEKMVFLERRGLIVFVKGASVILQLNNQFKGYTTDQVIELLSLSIKDFIDVCLRIEERLVLNTIHQITAPDYSLPLITLANIAQQTELLRIHL